MKREITISQDAIDELSLVRQRRLSPESGAVVCFLGVVRGVEGDRPIQSLEYEAFVAMAERQFGVLFDRIAERWPVQSVRLIHRVGVVPVGEPSLWVEVIAPHRGEAFAACQFLIDEMKRVVPIWKQPLA
jgi:molybdopterin synthase catalytic subunit